MHYLLGVAALEISSLSVDVRFSTASDSKFIKISHLSNWECVQQYSTYPSTLRDARCRGRATEIRG
jgi:hypothetical protein